MYSLSLLFHSYLSTTYQVIFTYGFAIGELPLLTVQHSAYIVHSLCFTVCTVIIMFMVSIFSLVTHTSNYI